MNLDEIDSKIIQYLRVQGRMTWAALAGALDLSAPATADRAVD
jgi:DNA-binding Lrp family transcriptional regulator